MIEPPPLPPDVAGTAKRGLSLPVIAGLVVSCAIGLVCAFGPTRGEVTRLKDRHVEEEATARAHCATNLEALAEHFSIRHGRGAPPARSGPGLFVAWRSERTVLLPGGESMLVCPSDPIAVKPDTREAEAAYAAADLDHPTPELCSYAVRDFAKFPLAATKGAAEPIAVCLHHAETLLVRGGAVVAYSDGRAAFVGYEELGISEGSELIVGPRSKSPLLRMMTFGDAREQ